MSLFYSGDFLPLIDPRVLRNSLILYFQPVCMQEAKALMIVRNLVKPFLLSDAISTKISCASAYPYQTAKACACTAISLVIIHTNLALKSLESSHGVLQL